jgi:putative tryptophan/tyrosine transport system substrate-binding protein
MRRRDFLGVLGGTIIAQPSGAWAQSSRMPRVGYLFSFKREQGQQLWEACRQGLRELGYVEGKNIAIEVRWTNGRYERLPELVAELIRLKVDVIVVAATPGSLAVQAATKTIPVVIVAVSDPTRIGLVDSLVRPGGNITGLSLLTPELSGKRLQLLLEIAPKIARVAVMLNPRNRSHSVFLDETTAASKEAHVAIHATNASNPEEIEKAFQGIALEKSQALIVFDDPVIWSHRKQVVALAEKARVPVMYGYSEFVLDGGLISYGPHRPDLYRRTAGYVDLILKGAKPADLPIERPTKFELMVNRKAAKAVGLEIPTAILLQADRVLE